MSQKNCETTLSSVTAPLMFSPSKQNLVELQLRKHVDPRQVNKQHDVSLWYDDDVTNLQCTGELETKICSKPSACLSLIMLHNFISHIFAESEDSLASNFH